MRRSIKGIQRHLWKRGGVRLGYKQTKEHVANRLNGRFYTTKTETAICDSCKQEFRAISRYYSSRGRRPKFCSNACRYEFLTGKKIPWMARPMTRMLQLKCGNCGANFSRFVSRKREKKIPFCSRVCAVQYNRGEKCRLWRGNRKSSRGPDWVEISEKARRFDGNKCAVCGFEEKRRVPVDHIVPYRLCKENNPVNLMCLCNTKGCHARKTAIEKKLLEGNVLGFIDGLRQLNWPMERVSAALIHYGYLRK